MNISEDGLPVRPETVVALLYLAFLSRGTLKVTLVGSIAVVPHDIVTGIVSLGIGAYVLRQHYSGKTRPDTDELRRQAGNLFEYLLGRNDYQLYVLSLIPFFFLVQTVRSPQPIRGFSLFLIIVRNTLIFLILAYLVSNISDLNKRIYYVGVGTSLLGLVLYFFGVQLDYPLINEAWPIISFSAYGNLRRFTGFVGDPNFYSIYASWAFFAGLYCEDISEWNRLLGIGIIGLTLFLSVSRSFMLGFGIAVLVGLAFLGLRKVVVYAVLGSIVAVVSSIVIGVLSFSGIKFEAVLTNPIRKPYFPLCRRDVGAIQNIACKLTETGAVSSLLQDRRFANWAGILRDYWSNPIIGHGSRGVETLNGGTAHSSYVGLLYDHGAVGLSMWVGLIGLTFKRLIQFRRNMALPPWMLVLIVFSVVAVFHSIQYDPFLWFVAGIGFVAAKEDQH